jgi:hypothetical protein
MKALPVRRDLATERPASGRIQDVKNVGTDFDL